MKQALINSTKELLRVVVLSIIPVLLAGLNPETGEVAINPQILMVVAGVAALRWVDKMLHETAEKDGWLNKQGLTGF